MRRKNAYDNVLHLTDYGAPYEGNFVSSLRALEAKLNGEGRAMTYVFPPRAVDRPWAQEMARAKPNVHILAPGGFFSYMRQVRHLLSETQAGILHVHFIHYREKIASLLAARTCGHRVKLVVHLHNHLDLPKNFLRALPQRLYLAQAEQFVCCSASVANRLIRDGIPQKKVVVAENAIAFERLDESIPLTLDALGWPAEAKTALIFGFDFYRKGVDFAVEAVRQLREEQEKERRSCRGALLAERGSGAEYPASARCRLPAGLDSPFTPQKRRWQLLPLCGRFSFAQPRGRFLLRAGRSRLLQNARGCQRHRRAKGFAPAGKRVLRSRRRQIACGGHFAPARTGAFGRPGCRVGGSKAPRCRGLLPFRLGGRRRSFVPQFAPTPVTCSPIRAKSLAYFVKCLFFRQIQG